MTFSDEYDSAVGDVNAAIDKLAALKTKLEARRDAVFTTVNKKPDFDLEEHFDTLADDVQQNIDALQTVVDFDHLALDEMPEDVPDVVAMIFAVFDDLHTCRVDQCNIIVPRAGMGCRWHGGRDITYEELRHVYKCRSGS